MELIELRIGQWVILMCMNGQRLRLLAAGNVKRLHVEVL